jgi:hypothetical protein
MRTHECRIVSLLPWQSFPVNCALAVISGELFWEMKIVWMGKVGAEIC